ncbi:secondary thiamine-phosphate synthase enzyme YjbQ [Candidatus Thiosymbion oneisti]|uniref:secondary thiamine-phosphate synthase enzyme YjbQ n=1 Tax=Candidatus Thiosymbion oneisti TaxID=589554 RepID=UPI000B7FD08F|nr:secondary thiamine-phosphate synthase enzyme YjbQ [Candidatus Thiosymbion oneisti]
MISIHHILTIPTDPGIALHDITPQIRGLVADSGMACGFLTVTSRHTTTAITINEHEERLLEDVRRFFTRLIPPGEAYLHNDIELRDCPPDEPENAHSHLLAMLVGSSEVIPIVAGDPDLGDWQSVMLVELDGPRERTVGLRLFGE